MKKVITLERWLLNTYPKGKAVLVQWEMFKRKERNKRQAALNRKLYIPKGTKPGRKPGYKVKKEAE